MPLFRVHWLPLMVQLLNWNHRVTLEETICATVLKKTSAGWGLLAIANVLYYYAWLFFALRRSASSKSFSLVSTRLLMA